MKKQETPAEAFLRDWLHGTTCGLVHRKLLSIQWQSKCGRFVVMKHKGHSEYCGRGSGTQWCSTYFRMYDLTKPMPRSAWGRDQSLMCIESRWSKANQAEAEAIVAGAA